MWALNRMGAAPENLRITEISIAASHEQQYEPNDFTVKTKQPIEITFRNKNGHPLNVSILKPGSTDAVGEKVDAGETSSDVLFSSKVIDSGESTKLQMIAPSTPGSYPFVSTTPKDWRQFRGTLRVKAPPPPPKKEE